jgi:hypothetical protein
MKLLTVESITQEALKILDKSFHDTYAKHNRKIIGGNDYVHATADGARTAEINGNDVEKNILF